MIGWRYYAYGYYYCLLEVNEDVIDWRYFSHNTLRYVYRRIKYLLISIVIYY